jgi:hypothetical protein
MQHCSQRLGESYFRTPRTTIISFIDLLAILEQNPEMQWNNNLIQKIDIAPDHGGDADKLNVGDDEFANFQLCPMVSRFSSTMNCTSSISKRRSMRRP